MNVFRRIMCCRDLVKLERVSRKPCTITPKKRCLTLLAILVILSISVNSWISTWTVHVRPVHPQTIVKVLRIPVDNGRNISLNNITQPLFTVFKEDYLKSNISFFTKGKKKITTLPYEHYINPKSLCATGETDLFIMIPSIAMDGNIRKDIRSTWASLVYDSKWRQNRTAKVVFFIGDSGLGKKNVDRLNTESAMFGDILTLNMFDSYKNLSLKVASGLLWSSKMCGTAKYVAKVDVDTFLNIPLLLRLLEQWPNISSSACVFGYSHNSHRPAALHSGKWEIPISIYPFDVLPRYVYGHSYVLSRIAVDRIVASFPYFPIVPNEDAFVTGIMSLVANVTRIHSPGFAHTGHRLAYKDIQDNRVVSSLHGKDNLVKIWNEKKRIIVNGF